MQRAARKDLIASIIMKSKGRGTPVAGCHGEAQLRCQQSGAGWLGDWLPYAQPPNTWFLAFDFKVDLHRRG